jgi:NAD(P)H-dependent nitrite reductase small subunit
MMAARFRAAPAGSAASIGGAAPAEAARVDAGWVEVCRLDDIVPNTGVCALLAGRQVAIFRLNADALYAIGNHDPLSGANVLSRGIVGDLAGEIVVASPIYKQHFSLVSGRCLEEPGVSVPVYAVRLDGAAVQVRAPQE